MKNCFKILFLVTVLTTTKSFATTWNEPWANQVIKEASSFVLAKVVSTDPEKGIRIQVIKMLGGKTLPDTLLISNFYLLDLCSSSGGHGAEFITETVDSCYFFLKKNNKDEYCIATPTTGFDYVYQNNVTATFRHSYHQASVPVQVYEKTMTAVYNNYHGLSYDRNYMDKFIKEYLQKSPAGFGEEEINTFFLQHVALECVYHLKLNIDESLVLPFLHDQDNFHNQISAARALRAIKTERSKTELLQAIADTGRRDFVRVMCVLSLAELKPKELKTQLQKLQQFASDESDGFGGNIMDPRVCTTLPSLRKTLKELIEKL
jgi:hypothetical protein